jgi:hypothetical protein
MIENNDKLLAKRNSLKALSVKLGQHLDDLPYYYPDEVFSTKLTRKLVKQSLNLRIDDYTIDRLNTVCNIPFNKDGRTAAEYAIDLIYGWLVEDMVAALLEQKGFAVEKTGVDREREFLKSGKIKSDIDLSVRHEDSVKEKSFDVYFDSQGYWKKTNRIDIRESKWKEIEKTSSGVLCISNDGFAIIDAGSEYTFGPNSSWGGKNCATIKGIRDNLVELPEFLILLKNNIANS